ncbi:cytochrome P450 CYP5280A1P [Stachybotrys elegans]|uniref:Cytochrome P450 CYP5280A1P n=1 Tax=Stachybotrys elegans TaxID=80388 RepID=A0A8K0SQ64_9HYPO|nr:cytochrome P450 CYP5280A1P [Stachybotrys elegans]
MFAVWLVASCLLFALVRPLIRYCQDPKGLRKYPNQNTFSGLTDLAYGWEVGRRHHLFHTRRLHQQLLKNPVVRVGPNWLSFGRGQAVRDIYGFNSPCLKGSIYDSLQSGGESLVLTTSREFHSQRRGMVAASYAPRNIELWEPRVVESTAILVSKLDSMCTTAPPGPGAAIPQEQLAFDANHWFMLYGFECAIKIGLSKDPGWLRQGSDLTLVTHPDGRKEYANIIDCMHSSSRANATLVWDAASFPIMKKLTNLLSPWYASQWHNASNWAAYIEQITAERVERGEQGEDLHDLCQLMIRDRNGEAANISAIDRITEVHQIVNGGGDGPAISLINTIYYLVKHPESMRKLREELDEALSPENVVAPWSKMKKLPYLRACIDESMRLSPPVATDLLRKTPSDRSYMVAGELIPPDTNVSISAYTAHRDPEYFPDPEAWKPERWLMNGDEKLRNMLAIYNPFSAGGRACIGRHEATLMQVVCIGTLIYRYDFALPSPDFEMQWTDYFNLWPVELRLKVWRRQPGTITLDSSTDA